MLDCLREIGCLGDMRQDLEPEPLGVGLCVVGGMGLGTEVSGTPSPTLARATPIFCICILGF